MVLGSIVAVRTLRFDSLQLKASTSPAGPIDTAAAARRLAGALRFRTVSHAEAQQVDSAAFLQLHRYLAGAFPRVHGQLRRETVSGLGLLYRWTGRDTSLKPVLFMAHTDVVPADTGGGAWEHAPFAGDVADRHVWGRGALDDKAAVTGLLEAVEMLLKQGFRPERTVYLAFGHDEEVGGARGAARTAALLKKRGVRLRYVLDEGGAIVQDAVPELDHPLALIGIAEKGYLSVELTVDGTGGHSAMPPPQTSISILSTALAELERNPLPPRLDGVTSTFLRYVGPELGGVLRTVMANLWLFGPLVRDRLAARNVSNALVRTTMAATVIRGGVKDNLLPESARAVVNFRLLPGTSAHRILEYVRQTIDDPRVVVRPVGEMSAPSEVSETDTPAFRLLRKSLREVYRGTDLVAAPYLVIGATDSRHYAPLAEQVYRFAPFVLGPDDRSRIHGTNERISFRDYVRMVGFYRRLIQHTDSLKSH